MTRTFQPGNSPFIIGLTSHPDLEPPKIPQLIDAVARFLLEIKQHLPDTQVRVMFDARNGVSIAIARAILALDVSVDALLAAGSDANPLQDLLNHPQVRQAEVAAGTSGAHADILMRRSSLLLALWDGKSSSAPDDTADQVFRFLGVRGEQSETHHRIEVSTDDNDLAVTAQLVFWIPARRSMDDGASFGTRTDCGSPGVGHSIQ